MNKSHSSVQTSSGKFLRGGVIFVGGLIFLLLFFADKTNLNNRTVSGVSATSVPSAARTNEGITAGLPPLAEDPQLDSWIAALDGKSNGEATVLLDSIVGELEERKRFAFASDYAQQAAVYDSSLQSILRVGKLSQQASNLPYVKQDSALFRKYSTRSITYLSELIAKDPKNEEGLLYLGLAMVESGLPQNSMQGIMTIRRVLEINPDNVEAGFQLGKFSLQTGQFEKAVQRFEKVLSISPDNFQAMIALAVAKMQLGENDTAQQLLETVIKDAPDSEVKLDARDLLNQIPKSNN